jgi:hypothetical protein
VPVGRAARRTWRHNGIRGPQLESERNQALLRAVVEVPLDALARPLLSVPVKGLLAP